MSSARSTGVVASAVVAAMVIGACGSSASQRATTAGGVPRSVEVKMLDTLRFEPGRVGVRTGERVRFVVTNAGKIAHEFLLGADNVQRMHEQQMVSASPMMSTAPMMSGGGMSGMGGADPMAFLTVAPGETKETTVTFTEPGKVVYACHVPAHYAAGMFGTVVVT